MHDLQLAGQCSRAMSPMLASVPQIEMSSSLQLSGSSLPLHRAGVVVVEEIVVLVSVAVDDVCGHVPHIAGHKAENQGPINALLQCKGFRQSSGSGSP